jgi:hypothetical protein
MIFLYDNKVDDYDLVASSCETGYSVTNLQDFQLSKVWRSTSDSTAWVSFGDTGTTRIAANYVAIAGHNLSTSAVVTLEAGTSDSWAVPTFSTVLTHSTGIIAQAITASTYNFWRFTFSDTSGGSTATYIETGRLFLGNKYTMASGSRPEIEYSIVDTSIVKWSLTGQSYGDEGITYKEIAGIDSPVMTNAERKAFEAMFNDVKRAEPVFLLVYETITTDLEPLYCNFVDEPKFQHIENMFWAMSPLTFREAK